MKTKSRQSQPAQSKRKRLETALLKLYAACLSNAQELVNEAELLLENGHIARAYALGFTAYEEIGKSQIVADRVDDIVSEAEFEEAFRSHTLKAAYVARHISLGTEGATVVYDRNAVKAYYQARIAALYVSLGPDNKPETPSAKISREQAEGVIDTVKSELDSIVNAEWLNQRIGTKGLFK